MGGHDERSLRGFQTYGQRMDYTRDVMEQGANSFAEFLNFGKTK